MRRGFFTIFSFLAILCLGAFLIFSGRGEEKIDLSTFEEVVPTVSPWQTYINKDYAYSLSYLRDWQKSEWDIKEAAKLEKLQDGMIWQQAKFEGKEKSFQVLIWVNRQKAAIPQWLRWYRHEDLDLKTIPQKANYQIFGKDAYLLFHEKPSWGYPAVHIFFNHEDKVFELIAQSPSENLDKIYEEMIGSFKLLQTE